MTAALLAINARTFASLRKHRNYRLFFSGQIVSLAGTWMQNVALAWYVVELTNSAVAVGFLAFCRFVPFTIFGLYAGVLADRLDNRRLVIATQAWQMAVSAALAVLALSGAEAVWAVYALALAGGIGLVFDGPGRHALTYQMVGREELPNAIALNSSLFNAARVVGPAIAGGLIATAGVGVCFAINTVSFVGVLVGLLMMRPEELVPLVRTSRPTFLGGVRELFAYVRRTPAVRAVLATVAVVSTVGFNFHVILPLLASQTLDAGPEVFGFLSAAFGGGALTGALLAASLGRASWKALMAGTAGFSVALLLLAPVSSAPPAAVLLFVTGVAFTLWTANSNSILQLTAPDHLRGRVVSLFLFAFAGLAPVGGLLAGWLVEVGGTELAFLVSGVVGLLMTAYALAQRPFAP
ncbi:MAG TPA: MFS transporter [Gaiellaceae bacterium]|nr:MFS transporter [Gaiellaceae bacterium]